MLSIVQNIPSLNTSPFMYVFEHMKIQHKPNTLWLEFGVASGRTIDLISKYTNDKVYGLIVLKDYLKNGVTVLIKVRSIEVDIYQK